MNKIKIIETFDYILAVSNEKIKEKFTNLTNDRDVFDYKDIKKCSLEYANKYWKKIIAYQPKHNSAPELNLPLLPKIVVEPRGFDEFQYTEEDLRKMYNLSCGKIGLGSIKDQTENNQRFQELLNIIIQSKLPTHFLLEKIENNKCIGTYI